MATRSSTTKSPKGKKIHKAESGPAVFYHKKLADHRSTFQLATAGELIEIVGKGVSFRSFLTFTNGTGFTEEQVRKAIALTPSVLAKRSAGGRFTVDESDRIVRLGRLWSAALDLHEGDEAAARRWMTTTKAALSGTRPLELARTEVGAREVEQLIGRLEHGVFS